MLNTKTHAELQQIAIGFIKRAERKAEIIKYDPDWETNEEIIEIVVQSAKDGYLLANYFIDEWLLARVKGHVK